MNTFDIYLRLGYEHILDVNGLDHILFVIALLAVYQPKSWLKMLAAVTFFTLGHSLTLTLSAFDLVDFDKTWIEFLIPVTIVMTSLYNLSSRGQSQTGASKNYIAALFGLIHGLGFGNYYSMLTLGEINYWKALLPFNLGVEIGQIVVVIALLVLMVIFQIIINVRQQLWVLFVSGATFGISLLMCIENFPSSKSLF